MPRCLRVTLTSVLLACAWAFPVHGTPARGQQALVTQVSDGDSIWVRVGTREPQRVRLRGIDAPESCQPHGRSARDALQAQVLGRTVLLQGRGSDDYGRLLRLISTETVPDVNAWMVAQGHAWSYRSGRGPGPYDGQQFQARMAGRGLWSRPDAIEPWVFRRHNGRCR
jgi:micrococcal nuclease